MEPLSFLSPNADNLFKFLFLNGVVMIAVSLFYPLQKSNELQLRMVEYNKKIELFEQDIIGLRDDSENLNVIVGDRIKVAESLVKKRKFLKSELAINDITNQINELKLKTNLSYQEIKKNKESIKQNQVKLKGEKSVIELLDKQVSVYDSYCFWLLFTGVFLGVIGFIGWSATTVFSEYSNYKDFVERLRKSRRIKRRRDSVRRHSTTTVSPQSPNNIP